MKFKDYQKKYEKSIDDYRKNIEKLINDLAPRVNIKLAIAGFLLAVSGIAPVLIILANASILNQPLTSIYLIACFFCFIISFVGYMLIHRSTERDWL